MDWKRLSQKTKKKIVNFFGKRNLKTKKMNRPKSGFSRKYIAIIIAVAAVILLTAAGGYYYYFYIFTKPNFDDALYNNIVTPSMEEVEPGDIITYEVNYKNNGYRTVDTLDIIIPVPDNVDLSSYPETGKFNEDKRILSFSFNDIQRDSTGKIAFELKVHNPLDNRTQIEMEDIIFSYTIKEERFEQVIKNNDFHIVKSSPDFTSFTVSSVDRNGGLLSLSDEITYIIKIKNTGNMVARDVKIISRQSPFLVTEEDSIGKDGEYTDGEITWELDQMEPGDSDTFIFSALLEAGNVSDMDEVITTAEVIYEGSAVNKKETVDIARLFPDFSESTAVLADANGGGYLWAGETINVKVTIKNTGQRKADDYQLYCPIPAPATYVSKSGTAEGIRWSDDIRGLIWDLSGLEVGESRDINFNMTVNNDYYYKSGTINTEFYIIAGQDEFPIEPASIYIQGHPYLNVVAMGDSLIAMSDWVQRLDNKLEAAFSAADYNTTASGIGGEMSFQGLARFDATIGPLHPTILIIAYGTNDTGVSYSYFKYSIDSMVAKGKNLGATVFLNLIGPDYQGGKESWPTYNQAILEVAAKYGVPVVDVPSVLQQNPGKYLADGVHYTPEGAEAVAQVVFNTIVPYLNNLGGRR